MNRSRLFRRLFAPLSLACAAACVLVGPTAIGLPDLSTDAGTAILTLRVQRVLDGFLVGAALAVSGAVLQALLRNPLADPYVLGVSSGSGLGAALAILGGLTARHLAALPLASFLAGGITLAIVYAVASGGGRPSVYGLILSGVIVSSICSSLLMFLLAVAPIEGLHDVLWWLLGSLQPASAGMLAAAAAFIGTGALGSWLLSNELNALTLGEDVAHYVGVRTGAALPAGLALATLTTASAVALAGLIGFVGLIVPHAARALVGADHRRLLPACALGGGAFLTVCDAVARTVLAPREIPVGVVTALLGGPFFLLVLRRRRRVGWMEGA